MMGSKTLLLNLAVLLQFIKFGYTLKEPFGNSHCLREENQYKCMFDVYCDSYFNGEMYYFRDDIVRIQGCEDKRENMYNYGGNYFYKVNLIFTSMYDFNLNPIRNDIGQLIETIDFSTLGLIYNPLQNEQDLLPLLSTLNFSNNNFVNAELSLPLSDDNNYNNGFPNVTSIDFSHNSISTIETEQDGRRSLFKELQKINLSYNHLESIPDAIFVDYAKLQYLDVSHNFIDAINTLTFEGLKKLEVLNISHNRISEINVSLLRFTNLEELDISHNQIENITVQDFEKLKQLKILNLSFNSLKIIESNLFNSLLLLEKIILNNNKLDQIKKDAFDSMNHLQYVDLDNNDIKTLPLHLFKDKSLTYFSIKNNKLENNLSKGMFDGMMPITELDLSFQRLNAVDSYAFFGLNKLEILLLNDNVLRTVSKSAFKSLYSLLTLDLSNNQLTDLASDDEDLINLQSLNLKNNFLTHVEHEYFVGLHALQFLDLSDNNITQLSPNCFHSLQQLVNFQISNNPLSGALVKNTFDGLHSLPSLDISGSQLKLIENGSFFGMSELKLLNLSRSNIELLHFNCFINTGTLQSIDLSYNQLSVFEVNTSDLFFLDSLILNNNRIIHVSANHLEKLKRLSFINLSHNDIEIIDDETVGDLDDLRILDISFNPRLHVHFSHVKQISDLYFSGILTNITFKDISIGSTSVSSLELSSAGIQSIIQVDVRKLNKLTKLVLSRNNIAKVEVGAFSNMSQLVKIDLSYNKIDYIQPGAFKSNSMLNLLNVSHNFLKSINYGVFRGLAELKVIDISYNIIDNLKSERFYEVPNLNELIADHNRITTISREEFSGTSLTTLSIGENPIPCELIVNFKNSPPLMRIKPLFIQPLLITAINLDEHNGENIDGIRCNMEDFKPLITHTEHNGNVNDTNKILLEIRDVINNNSLQTNSQTYNILLEIRDVMYNNSLQNNFQAKRSQNNPNLFFNLTKNIEDSILNAISNASKNVRDEMSYIGNITLGGILAKENNRTVTTLDKILNTLETNIDGKLSPIIIPKQVDNVTTDYNMIAYINKIKQDLEGTIIAEKQNILKQMRQHVSDIENKISHIQENSKVSQELNQTNIPAHDALIKNDLHHEQTSEPKSFIFMETCVALILIILVAFIIYKIYNSNISLMLIPTRRSPSTRNLPDEENSAL